MIGLVASILMSCFPIAGHLVNFYHVGTQPIEHLHCLSRELNFPSDGKPTISYWLFQVITCFDALTANF